MLIHEERLIITAEDIGAALRELGVASADTLFVHSDMSRLLRAAGTTRAEKLDTVVAGLSSAVAEGTLMLPTFTYSFCRSEPFDLAQSQSTVGILSEHFRRQPGVRRTAEPIFSTAVRGPVASSWNADLFTPGDKNCFGERSVFSYLLETDAQIAFLGADTASCTFVYLAEQRAQVSYRYFKDFRGVVINGSESWPATARYYVRRLELEVENSFAALFDELRRGDELGETELGRGATLKVVSARAVAAAAQDGLRSSPAYLLAGEGVGSVSDA